MANTNDLLQTRLKEVIKQRDDAQAALEPHRMAINETYVEIQKLKDTLTPHRDALLAATPLLKSIEREISNLARAFGGKSISDV